MAVAIEPALIDLAENQVRTSTSLFSVIWQRKPLVILGIVIALVLGALFYAQRQPQFQSVAQILVVKKSVDPIATRGAGQVFYEDYMSTQTVLLKSQVIALATATAPEVKRKFDEEGGLLSFPDCKKAEELIPEIMKNLTVTRENRENSNQQTSNNVLLLGFRATNAKECQLILENLIQGYQGYIDYTYADLSQKVAKQYAESRKKLEAEIKETEDKLAEFYNNTKASNSRFAGGTSETQKWAQTKLDQLVAAKKDYEFKSREFHKLNKIYETHGPTRTIQFLYAYRQSVLPKYGDERLEQRITELRLALSRASQKFGPKHPEVVDIQNAIDELERLASTKEARDVKEAKIPEKDAAKSFLDNLEMEVKSLSEQVEAYEQDYAKAELKSKELLKSLFEEESLRDRRERSKMAWQRLNEQSKDMDRNQDSGGFKVQTITPPIVGIKVAPNAYQVFAAAGLLGVLLGVGLAYLAEISDKSFRNPMEIRKRLGLPVIGHVPFLAADEKAAQLVASGSTTVDPMLITHYQSNSVGAEAYRGVRTALYFSTQGAGHQVIQVTSPNVSDGKSTLAANLAVSIAQSGKKTLLIDADFRKPRVHKIFNVPATCGMASVIVGQADLQSATQPTAIPNLSVMPCGPRPANPAELLTSPKFKEIIEELRNQYDFIIVDTPPILVVTDPSVVAPRVDGVVLCIRVTKNGRPYAERARDVLTSLGANVLGVVVNGFGTQVGGNKYGYEHYQYGYGEGYAYTYGYTYGYADKEAASYYAGANDERPGTPAVKS